MYAVLKIILRINQVTANNVQLEVMWRKTLAGLIDLKARFKDELRVPTKG